jgi:hypothetical protein
MMSNKPHLHPHQEERHASRITRLFVAILVLAIFALIIALEVTGHVIFRGRLVQSGPTGRRAALAGGPDVWEVIRAVKSAHVAEPELTRDDLVPQPTTFAPEFQP